jgi:hypothetical protein
VSGVSASLGTGKGRLAVGSDALRFTSDASQPRRGCRRCQPAQAALHFTLVVYMLHSAPCSQTLVVQDEAYRAANGSGSESGSTFVERSDPSGTEGEFGKQDGKGGWMQSFAVGSTGGALGLINAGRNDICQRGAQVHCLVYILQSLHSHNVYVLQCSHFAMLPLRGARVHRMAHILRCLGLGDEL